MGRGRKDTERRPEINTRFLRHPALGCLWSPLIHFQPSPPLRGTLQSQVTSFSDPPVKKNIPLSATHTLLGCQKHLLGSHRGLTQSSCWKAPCVFGHQVPEATAWAVPSAPPRSVSSQHTPSAPSVSSQWTPREGEPAGGDGVVPRVRAAPPPHPATKPEARRGRSAARTRPSWPATCASASPLSSPSRRGESLLPCHLRPRPRVSRKSAPAEPSCGRREGAGRYSAPESQSEELGRAGTFA